MTRPIFPEAHVHPAIREKLASHHRDIIAEVEAAVAAHDVVVVGMAQNPWPRRARALLDAQGVAHHDLDYGSYVSEWRRRTALKMWTGWPTFPMIWVKGTFVGGAQDLQRLVEGGELKSLLAAPRAA